MKVLMLASCFPTDRDPYLCLFLKELDEQITKLIPEHYVLSLHGYTKFRLLKRLNEIRKFINNNKIDIIHAQFGYSAGFFGSLIKQKRKFIVTVHRFELFDKKKRPLVKYGLKKADLIIAVSSYIAEEIKKLYSKFEKKMIVLPNGVNTKKFAREEVREVKETETLRIGTLAHHSKRKGIDKLIRAFKKLEEKNENVFLHIAGKGSETENLKQLAHELKIKNIEFLGSITEEEKVNFYRMLDIFVLSSDSEGHPVALLESMCTGVCPVVTNIPSIRETVFDKENGRVCELEDINQLADILIDLSRDYKTLNIYKKEARKIVLEKYDLKKRAEKLSKIYAQLLEENKLDVETFN